VGRYVIQLSPTTNPNAARDDAHIIVVPPDDYCIEVPPDDYIIEVPPDDYCIEVPPPGPDDCVVVLPDGSRWWVSLPPPVRGVLPHGLRVEGACEPRRLPPPNGLLTAAQAAARLGISIRTLREHVATGALRYVNVGHGRKRVHRMFTDADLDAFIANQTRKDVPCPSTASRARHTGTSNSVSKIIAFTAAPKPRPGAKPKK
jgi:excisionase family DNA binding protein